MALCNIVKMLKSIFMSGLKHLHKHTLMMYTINSATDKTEGTTAYTAPLFQWQTDGHEYQ